MFYELIIHILLNFCSAAYPVFRAIFYAIGLNFLSCGARAALFFISLQ